MKQFHNGVKFYTEAACPVFFPEDDRCCYWCPILGVESRTERHYCKLTGEYIPIPQAGLGYRCPLIFEKENDNES